MSQATQQTMQAAAIDQFGGPEKLTPHTLPLPEIGPDEILIRVESAGIGVWDSFEREGGFVELGMASKPRFPYVLGSDGAGTVVDVGHNVRGFGRGDRVYAYGFMNPKGGFYAQYAAVKADHASHIPGGLTVEQAGAMAVDAMTALRGLDDVLKLKQSESIIILGASGGVGHLAVQLAKRMGAHVLAVASGSDGVELAKRLGADVAIDGRKDDIVAVAKRFAVEGVDAALITAGGKAAEKAIQVLRDGGRGAYPNGVEPAPQGRSGVRVEGYDGTPSSEAIRRLNRLIEQGPFEVHIAQTFPLNRAGEAHRVLETHFLGKLAFRPN